MEWKAGPGKTLRLMVGDITRVPADAIVNAANAALAGGGGVDGAIHRAGGPAIMQELRHYQGCPTGSAVATTAGNLPARWVFHAVGPIYRDGRHDEERLLASAYQACLDLAEQHEAERLTFPSISTGAYGYPLEQAAPVALRTVMNHLSRSETKVREATFVLFDERTYAVYERHCARLTAAEGGGPPASTNAGGAG
jgi:O-acetyl-ADP-ribose deacetylase (regulator of RNase III)